MFDWSDARLFLSISRRGSLTAAARELRLDQTTVGRRLAALEASLGAKLFHRRRDGLALTQVGHAALPYAERMEQEALAFDEAARGRDTATAGVVRVTTLESFGSRFLAPRLPLLRRKHPALRLDLLTDNRSLNLSRREAELAVRLGKPAQEGLTTRRIGAIAYAVYGAPAYLEAPGRKRSFRELATHDLLGLDDDLSFVPEARWLAKLGGAERVLRSNSVAVLEGAAAAGLGLAVLPCFIADARTDLVRVIAPSEVVVRDLWLVLHPELRAVARVRAVADFLAEAVQAAEPLLLGRGPRAR